MTRGELLHWVNSCKQDSMKIVEKDERMNKNEVKKPAFLNERTPVHGMKQTIYG